MSFRLGLALYVFVIAGLTAFTARHKGRSGPVWFVGGMAGGFPLLLLALIAPPAGQPWRSRALLAILLWAAVLLFVVLVIVAISEANFATP